MTPLGRSTASAITLATKAATCADCAGILITVVQPAANAGAKERIMSTMGEFQGTITPATPTACRNTIDTLPGLGSTARPYSVRASDAKYRSLAGTISTSKVASGFTLPFSRASSSMSSSRCRAKASANWLSTRSRSCRSRFQFVSAKARLAAAIQALAASTPPSA